MGDGQAALLAHHGVFVAARSINEAYIRCMVLEWRSRQAWMVEALGKADPMPRESADIMAQRIDRVGYRALWEAMVRREIRLDPFVLE
jgi:ribulose-5-phosphate 4-epimerase/fuculose-1-phosphate aldolase